MKRPKPYRYNPLKEPKPKVWLSMDEEKRIRLIEEYHKRARIEMPNIKVHATFHAMVENQAALRDETPVAAKLRQLQRQGLDRHEALHAIGSVLSEFFFDMMQGDEEVNDANELYFEKVKKLTKDSWYEDYG